MEIFNATNIYIIISCFCCLLIMCTEFYGKRVAKTKSRILVNMFIMFTFACDVVIAYALPYIFPVLKTIGV